MTIVTIILMLQKIIRVQKITIIRISLPTEVSAKILIMLSNFNREIKQISIVLFFKGQKVN